jgi:hypothetical protein
MSKRIAVVLGMVAVLGCASLAQASLFVDFESPTYTTGAINGQDGWTSTGGGVYGSPFNIAGAQSMEPGIGDTATYRSLAGTGYTDSTTFTTMLEFYPAYGAEAELYLDAGNSTIIAFGAESRDGWNIVRRDDVGWHNLASSYQSSPTLRLFAEATINFTTQTYDLTMTDMNNTANTWSVSGANFVQSVTKAQAEAGGWVTFYRGGMDFFVDNIGINATAPAPEPSTLALLTIACAGLLAYAWRKRK